MDKFNNDNVDNSLLSHDDSETNKSFVKKVTSRVSGLLPTSLSKWFGGNEDGSTSSVRQRDDLDDEEEDEFLKIQPPSKKLKLPDRNDLHNDRSDLQNDNHLNLPSTSTNLFKYNHLRNNVTNDNSSLPAPVAGPSGISSRRTLNPQITSTAKKPEKETDSICSNTSGYSSLAKNDNKDYTFNSSPTKEKSAINISNAHSSRSFFNSTNTPDKPERSLFVNRMTSPNGNTSLSSRRPSFNASTLGSLNALDQTLSTKSIINSPFYKGRTTYGGASAYNRLKCFRSNPETNTSSRNSIQIKPNNENNTKTDKTSLSKTARRILETLEHYTTPLAEVKKIPVPTMKKSQTREIFVNKSTYSHPYVNRAKPSNRELQVPTVPDLLQMKLKERLQDSTVSVRELANTSNSELNRRDYKIRTIHENNSKHSNKMKTKITSTRTKQHHEEKIQEVQLPNIQLPISTLPKFDFNLPTPNAISNNKTNQSPNKDSNNLNNKSSEKEKPKTLVNATSTTAVNVTSTTDSKKHEEFKFSEPIVIASNMKHIKAINNFKFSEPLSKKNETKLAFKSSENCMLLKKKHNGENTQLITTGSVVEKQENLAEKFKPAEGTWECSVCLIRNNAENDRCAACNAKKIQTPKKIVTNDTTINLNKFKVGSDKWECASCLVRNNNNDVKCVACTAAKPIANGSISSTTPKSVGFGSIFKPPTNTWECGVCMIRNKLDLDKCAACESLKPNNKPATIPAFGNSFKKKENEWECGSCMVRNSPDNDKCVCCETAKPGSNQIKVKTIVDPNKSTSTFNFGIDKNTFTFGIKPTENKPTGLSTAGFQFGNQQANKSTDKVDTTTQFKFGAQPSQVPNPTLSFGMPKKEEDTKKTNNNQTGISFGVKSSSEVKKPETSAPPNKETPKITFDIPKNKESTSSVAAAPSVTTNASIAKPAPPQFTFGSNNASSPLNSDIHKNKINSNKDDFNKTSTDNNKVFSNTNKMQFKQDSNLNKPVTNSMFKFGSTSTTSTPNTQPSPSSSGLFNVVNSTPKRPLNDVETVAKKKFELSNNTKNNLFQKVNPAPKKDPNSLFEKKPEQTTTPAAFTFGNAPKNNFSFGNNATVSNSNIFGAAPNNQPSPMFNFNATTTKTTEAATSLFGSNVAESKSSTNIFGSASNIFGAPNQTAPSESKEPPKFSFTQTKAPDINTNPAPPPVFSFGGGTTTPAINFNSNTNVTDRNSFKFGAEQSEQTAVFNPQQQNLFDSSQTTPRNGGFNFSNTNNTPKTGYSFGNPSAGGGVFSFGSSNDNSQPPASAPTGSGFNFGNPVPQFNANVRPTFNFTGGTPVPVFSAPSTPAEKPHRVMRKALRRTQR